MYLHHVFCICTCSDTVQKCNEQMYKYILDFLLKIADPEYKNILIFSFILVPATISCAIVPCTLYFPLLTCKTVLCNLSFLLFSFIIVSRTRYFLNEPLGKLFYVLYLVYRCYICTPFIFVAFFITHSMSLQVCTWAVPMYSVF